MGGIGLIIAVGLYFWLAIKIVVSAWRRRWKFGVAVLVVMILLPTTDAVIGRLYLKHLCATEGGLHVKQVVEGVEGFYMDGALRDFLKYHGYTFIENTSSAFHRPPNSVERYILRDSNIVKEDPVPPRSEYELTHSLENRGFYFKDYRTSVRQISNKQELGSYDHFIFLGGWAEKFLGGFADAGGMVAACEKPSQDITILTATSILKSKQ